MPPERQWTSVASEEAVVHLLPQVETVWKEHLLPPQRQVDNINCLNLWTSVDFPRRPSTPSTPSMLIMDPWLLSRQDILIDDKITKILAPGANDIK